MEDAGAGEAVRACMNALERSIDNRFVVLTSACVDSICAVKILKESLEATAPAPPTIRTVVNLEGLKDAVAKEQLCGGPRVFFFINCGGLDHEFEQLDLMVGGVAIFLDHRRPVPIADEPEGVEVTWMGFEGPDVALIDHDHLCPPLETQTVQVLVVSHLGMPILGGMWEKSQGQMHDIATTTNGDYRRSVGTPSSVCALFLAQQFNVQSRKCLWYAILGQTDVAHLCGVLMEQIKSWQRLLRGQATFEDWGIRSGINTGHSLEEDFTLPFFRHTSLWDSLRMSGIIMAKLECWRPQSGGLAEFIVDLGIPTAKSEIPYGTFMAEHGHNLDEKLLECGVQWGLHDLKSPVFKIKTATGELSAEDEALALRSALAAVSGQCDLPSISEGIRSAMKILTGGDKRVKAAATQYQRQMSTIVASGGLFSRCRKKELRIFNLNKSKDTVDSTEQLKCPFWLELLARHAMDYSNVPALFVGLTTENDRVALVGWGNCNMEGTSSQQPCSMAHMMLEAAISMRCRGEEGLECIAFQMHMWRMKKRSVKEFLSLLTRKIQGGSAKETLKKKRRQTT